MCANKGLLTPYETINIRALVIAQLPIVCFVGDYLEAISQFVAMSSGASTQVGYTCLGLVLKWWLIYVGN